MKRWKALHPTELEKISKARGYLRIVSPLQSEFAKALGITKAGRFIL